jgi:hypothetical protein
MAGRAFILCELYDGIPPFKFKKLPHGEEEKENRFHNEDSLHMFKWTAIFK